MQEKTWFEIPLHEAIVRILALKKGAITDRELYEALSSMYNVSYTDFLKTLMKLELNGVIKVATAREGALLIEMK